MEILNDFGQQSDGGKFTKISNEGRFLFEKTFDKTSAQIFFFA